MGLVSIWTDETFRTYSRYLDRLFRDLEYESEFLVHRYNMNALGFWDEISMVREGGELNNTYQFVDWQ